jgi:hypothetical protein
MAPEAAKLIEIITIYLELSKPKAADLFQGAGIADISQLNLPAKFAW